MANDTKAPPIPAAVEQINEERLEAIEKRLDKIEANLTVIRDGFQFAGDNLRDVFGLSVAGRVFDEIHRNMKK